MSGRSVPPLTALYRAFRQPLQAAISCFSRATLQGLRPTAADEALPIWLNEDPTPLGRRAVFSLRFAHEYRIAQRAGKWEVQTTAYAYWLQDRQGNELLLYQWSTAAESKVTTPHLHIRAIAKLTEANLPEVHLPSTSGEAVQRLSRAHLPTGYITLAEILRMAIDDLGVEPLEADPDIVARRLAAADAVLRGSLVWRMTS